MKRLPAIVRLTAAVLVVLPLSGCVKGQAGSPFAPPSAAQTRIQVRVENQNFADATIHALRGGERVRLGSVTGKSDETFNVRWNFSLPMEFEIELLGGQGCRIRPLTVDPGDRVFVRIPTELSAQACYSGKMR